MIFDWCLVRSFLWRKPQRSPTEEIEDYCTYFNNKYGITHPAFYRGTLSQVLNLVFSVKSSFHFFK